VQRLTHDPNQAELRKDMRRALLALDLDWGRRMFPGAPDADIEIALHKARYHATDISRHARHQSAQWLKARHLADALGAPILPEGQLPR